MEFLLFLSSNEKEILELIYKAGFSVEEDNPLCLMGKKYVGFTKSRQKSVIICTQNIKNHHKYTSSKSAFVYKRDKLSTAISIKKALRHEATHVAQACNNSKPLGIVKTKGNIHKWYKRDAIEGSTIVGTGKIEKEEEAYYMEERPKKLITALRKYCL